MKRIYWNTVFVLLLLSSLAVPVLAQEEASEESAAGVGIFILLVGLGALGAIAMFSMSKQSSSSDSDET